MKRKDALNWVKIAGYHNNSELGTRVYIESRLSRRAYDDAWASGMDAKRNGMPCTCRECKA